MTTYVLIPGAGGSSWYWHGVAEELVRRGRDVVAVDLPGADAAAGLPEYVDTVVDAVGERGELGELVVVGQSLGAFTAPLVCTRLPVSLLVLVNGMIPRPGETPGEWWAHTGQEAARRANDVREGRDPDAPFDLTTYFLHDLDQAEIDASAEHAEEESDAVLATPFALEAWPQVPTRVVAARDDRLFPAAFQRQVAQDRLGITPDEVPGGHLAALSHPGELADLLEAYVRASA
ncbi:alpha/beta hydrolase [Streptomyces sp. ERV7]|uniref:alpha/beta fold hydrolase n=1 Tax=Streptomyces sp. ERV7 TaxID=1322334 RepID=UPI0007F35A30|nr:alpha/beta fold hydrolase [Streptomyces sp. ERV7]OAR22781.1 alpha/beta hydrolase [Streptomyces sp. ERV7]